jgi:predicted Zn-dependent peptidase
MQNLLFQSSTIEKVKKTIRDEIVAPNRDLLSRGLVALLSEAFRVHPYRWTATGSKLGLRNTTKQELQHFYKQYYAPNNALLIVAGDVDESTLRQSIAKHFMAIKPSAEAPRPSKSKPEPVQSGRRLKELAAARSGIAMSGYHIPRAAHEDIPALKVLAQIIETKTGERLERSLDTEHRVVQEVGSQLMLREEPGLFVFYATFLGETSRETWADILDTELSNFRASKLSDDDIKRALKQLRSRVAFEGRTPSGVANQVGQHWIRTGELDRFDTRHSTLGDVRPSDVMRIATTYFAKTKQTTIVIPPQRKP